MEISHILQLRNRGQPCKEGRKKWRDQETEKRGHGRTRRKKEEKEGAKKLRNRSKETK